MGRGSWGTNGKLKPKFGDLALCTGGREGDAGGREGDAGGTCPIAWSLREGLGM